MNLRDIMLSKISQMLKTADSKLLVHRHGRSKSVVFKVRCWFPLREKALTGQELLKNLALGSGDTGAYTCKN